ncbi:hypothetical protein DY000_02015987 [Brassica cretica]|uniref:Uncharacterized protein n=1 Tax=Brassica cretica TaxID=69181 RepID=A0ABQ7CZ97_BRACR|nr:hypothetical protein DY000_02015987 [Brassica cretica]
MQTPNTLSGAEYNILFNPMRNMEQIIDKKKFPNANCGNILNVKMTTLEASTLQKSVETAYLDVVFSNIFEVVNALIEQLISVALCLSGEALWIPTQTISLLMRLI